MLPRRRPYPGHAGADRSPRPLRTHHVPPGDEAISHIDPRAPRAPDAGPGARRACARGPRRWARGGSPMGWIVAVISGEGGGKGESTSSPRCCVSRNARPRIAWAAVAPMRTRTRGRRSSSSCSSHGRHALTSRALGFLRRRRLSLATGAVVRLAACSFDRAHAASTAPLAHRGGFVRAHVPGRGGLRARRAALPRAPRERSAGDPARGGRRAALRLAGRGRPAAGRARASGGAPLGEPPGGHARGPAHAVRDGSTTNETGLLEALLFPGAYAAFGPRLTTPGPFLVDGRMATRAPTRTCSSRGCARSTRARARTPGGVEG